MLNAAVALVLYVLLPREVRAALLTMLAIAGTVSVLGVTAAVYLLVRRNISGPMSECRTAAGKIAAGTADLSHRTQDQAASLEETAAAMDELTSTVRQNADNAREADALVYAAAKLAKEGGELVAQVVTTMGDIKASSQRIEDMPA